MLKRKKKKKDVTFYPSQLSPKAMHISEGDLFPEDRTVFVV